MILKRSCGAGSRVREKLINRSNDSIKPNNHTRRNEDGEAVRSSVERGPRKVAVLRSRYPRPVAEG